MHKMPRIDHIIERLERSGSREISLEFLPPKGTLKEKGPHLQDLLEYKPQWVSVTCHQDGCGVRGNPDELIHYLHEQQRFTGQGYSIVPHQICGGYSAEQITARISNLRPENVVCIRGDPNTETASGKIFCSHRDGFEYGVQLIEHVATNNPDICVIAPGYPRCSAKELIWTREKQNAGASALFLQMDFSADMILAYAERARDVGIDVPIIPGLKVLERPEQMNLLEDVFGVPIPDDLRALTNYEDFEGASRDYMLEQAGILYGSGFPVLHIYTCNRSGSVGRFLDRLDYGASHPAMETLAAIGSGS